jgi:hypothetical protein
MEARCSFETPVTPYPTSKASLPLPPAENPIAVYYYYYYYYYYITEDLDLMVTSELTQIVNIWIGIT